MNRPIFEGRRPPSRSLRRLVAALVVLAAACGLQPAARVEAQAPPPPPPPCASLPPGASEPCLPDKLDFPKGLRTVADLPSARKNRPYRTKVLTGGSPPYAWDLISGLPPELTLTPDGFLVGTPRRTGPYHPRVEAHDSATPAQTVGGEWRLRVWEPRPRPSISTSKSTASTATLADTQPTPEEHPIEYDGRMTIFCLSARDLLLLKEGVAPPQKPAKTPAPCPGKPRGPDTGSTIDPESVELLRPMTNVEYPTQTLFYAALSHRLGKTAADDPAVFEIARERAAYDVDFSNGPIPRWSATTPCGCVPPSRVRYSHVVYGFLPFWRDAAPGPAIDFGLYDRIGVLGARLGSRGDWITSHLEAANGEAASVFARTAHSHGTRLDLVLQRNDWFFLTQDDPVGVTSKARIAAAGAVTLIDTPLTDNAAWIRGLLLPGWHTPKHVFDGVTVMFTPPDAKDVETAQAYRSFRDQFMTFLISDLKLRDRDFTVNVMIDDRPICVTANSAECGVAYDLNTLVSYRDLAESDLQPPRATSRGAWTGAKPPKPAGTSLGSRLFPHKPQITMHFMTMTQEYTGQSKKELRQALDKVEDQPGGKTVFEGAERVRLLDSIVPMLTPAAAEFDMSANDKDRLAKDLAYLNQNFGGAAMWPVVVSDGEKAKAHREVIADEFDGDPHKDALDQFEAAVQSVLRPCSTVIRLGWEFLVLTTLVLLALYGFADASEGLRRIYLYATAGAAALTLMLGLYLLYSDPTLDGLRTGNRILVGIMTCFFGAAILYAFKDKIRAP